MKIKIKILLLSFMTLALLNGSALASRVLQDDVGRKVSVPDQVHRVICLAPNITETVYAIGAANQIVGITDFTDYPPEAARQKPSVGELLHPSLERIASLRPELVVGISTMNSMDTVRALERLGIPVFLLNPQGFSGIYRDIDLIGRLLGRERDATALIVRLKAREQAVRNRAKASTRPTVFLVLGIEPVITAGRGAFITEMIEAAGARSITDDQPQDWLRFSLEAVIPRKPDYLLVVKGSPVGIRELRQHPIWNRLDAVRQGRVITIDNRMQVPGPIAFDGLEDFSRQLHPQAH